jgi:hypothetical protein
VLGVGVVGLRSDHAQPVGRPRHRDERPLEQEGAVERPLEGRPCGASELRGEREGGRLEPPLAEKDLQALEPRVPFTLTFHDSLLSSRCTLIESVPTTGTHRFRIR